MKIAKAIIILTVIVYKIGGTMITKEELRGYVHLQTEVEELPETLEKLQAQAYLIGATKINGAPAGSGSPDKIANNLAKLESLQEYYLDKLDKKLDLQRRIEDAIESLPDRERLLIRYRYIDGKNWIEIAATMGYSWQQTHRIHAKALELLKDETK